MKNINIVIIISLFSFLYSNAQEDSFERELKNFRFSLNMVLEQYEDEKVYKLDFNKKDSLIIYIDNFTAKNKANIKKHREKILASYKDNPDFRFDTTKYKKVDVSEINNNLKDFDLKENVPLSQLLWIDPMIEISSLKTIYYSREKGAAELAVYTTKANIATSLIKTRKLGYSQWEIIDNSYAVVGKFIYDLNKGCVVHMELFELK